MTAELSTLQAELNEIAEYARGLEDDNRRLRGLLEEAERGRSAFQYREYVPREHAG